MGAVRGYRSATTMAETSMDSATTMADAPPSSSGDEWLTLADAAERSGLSVDALRRRVRRGRIRSRKVDGPRGPVWLVDAGGLATTMAGGGATRVNGSAMTVAPTTANGHHDGGGVVELELLARLDRLQAELLLRTEAASAWQGRAEILAAELARTREQLALMAPKDEPEPPRPWWAFWRD
jgi:hypothetical protein